jgi:hypothetical protein
MHQGYHRKFDKNNSIVGDLSKNIINCTIPQTCNEMQAYSVTLLILAKILYLHPP